MSNPSAQPIQQNAQSNNAKYMSIIPENGTEFVQRQKIVFNLDPSLGWIKGRDSYLVFDILNTSTTGVRTTLANAGISSIVKQVNIYSQHSGMLLESLNDYNKWVATELQYRYDDFGSLCAIEGCPTNMEARGTITPNVNIPDSFNNPAVNYSLTGENRLSAINSLGQPIFSSVKYCMPLRCGIFRNWDVEQLVPILQMGGLRIELILAENHEVLTLPWVGNDKGTQAVYSLNHMVGSTENLFKDIAVRGSAAANPIPATGAAADVVVEILSTDINLKSCGLAVGNKLIIRGANETGGADSGELKGYIKALAIANSRVSITLTMIDPIANGGMKPATATGVSQANAKIYLQPLTESDISYKITNAEFRLLQEMPPDQKMKNINYTFTSYDLFRDTIPQSQVNAVSDITSVASKAVSIFSMYSDLKYDNVLSCGHQSYYAGLSPYMKGWELNSVVYFINNKLYPLRAYNPSPKEDKVINQNELVKAFGTLGIPVKHLGSAKGADLDIYTNRYIHARELARSPNVFNLQNAEPQIRLGFATDRNQVNNHFGFKCVNTRMDTFVFSKKILQIDGQEGLQLIH